MSEHYIGLMSGTSMDGIDAVLVHFGEREVGILATHKAPYPAELRERLHKAAGTPVNEPIDDIGGLDRAVGECFRDAANAVLATSGLDAATIRAIGSHGQTVRHQPDAIRPYSLQIGNPALIADGTNISTVGDFRSADIEAGGQGAPLVPPFHEWLFRTPDANRVVANIGGIANITVLGPTGTPVVGFDTGPGNALLDRWIHVHRGEPFDADGGWAAEGTCDELLLKRLLSFEYFDLAPPKSTGLEDFNLHWLQKYLTDAHTPVDVQATLCELTARSIADAIRDHARQTDQLFVCGGGAHNLELLRRLGRNLPETSIDTTATVGLDPDWVEAVAFAWLAMRTMNDETGNLPSVTGASRKVVLGTIHSR
ncbi:MAG: anhydro-N-acetylmuramic acid kinase [Woeseiaceae bacterium]|nr:anhydro-N-acetylmuramic acid kinase [Woeseiaceae bacterium]